MKKILIVEDNAEQVSIAVQVVEAAGYEAVTAQTYQEIQAVIGDVDGVLSDLEFNPLNCRYTKFEHYEENPPMAGLLVLVLAQAMGKPVSVCTDGDHHGEELSWIHDGFLGAFCSLIHI